VRINQIRALIQTEEDNKKFTALVIELNELVEAREHRSAEDSKRDPLCRGARTGWWLPAADKLDFETVSRSKTK
jgi:hypothetical protein